MPSVISLVSTGTPFANAPLHHLLMLPLNRKNPKQHRESVAKQRENRERERSIPALLCKQTLAHCGYEGVVRYHHEPKTTYQVRARLEPTEDLQHYTKCLLPKKVERYEMTIIIFEIIWTDDLNRVVTIPLNPNSDYRSQCDLEYRFQNYYSIFIQVYDPIFMSGNLRTHHRVWRNRISDLVKSRPFFATSEQTAHVCSRGRSLRTIGRRWVVPNHRNEHGSHRKAEQGAQSLCMCLRCLAGVLLIPQNSASEW